MNTKIIKALSTEELENISSGVAVGKVAVVIGRAVEAVFAGIGVISVACLCFAAYKSRKMKNEILRDSDPQKFDMDALETLILKHDRN